MDIFVNLVIAPTKRRGTGAAHLYENNNLYWLGKDPYVTNYLLENIFYNIPVLIVEKPIQLF